METPGSAVIGRDLPLGEPSDRALLQRFQQGSQDAATEIYQRYVRRLQALTRDKCSALLARREEVDDIIQSVFGSFFRNARRGHYDLPAGDELWKLLLVIALNKIRAKGNFHRAAKRDVRRTLGLEGGDESSRTDHTPACDDASFLQVAMEDALERLPLVHREMVLLRIDGYQVAEIADKTQHSKRSVERILQKTREYLADLLYPDN